MDFRGLSENGCGNDIFGLKSRQDLKKRAAHPNQEFPAVPPGAFRSEKKSYLVYYDQHLSEIQSLSPLQKSETVWTEAPSGSQFFFGITFLGSLATKLRIVTEPSHLVSNPSWPVYMLFVQLATKVVKGL